MTIVDDIPDGESAEKSIAVANMTKKTMKVRLAFRSPNTVSLTSTSALAQSTATKNVLQWGTVKVGLEDGLFDKWQNSNDTGKGVSLDTERAKTIKVTGADAKIEDITLEPGEERIVKFIFTPFVESANDKNQYTFDVIQYQFDGKTFKEIGGVRFVVKPPVTKLK